MVLLILTTIIFLFLAFYIYKRAFYQGPRKVLSQGTTILITGGAQGLGKLLSLEFIEEHKSKINMIILDINETLG